MSHYLSVVTNFQSPYRRLFCYRFVREDINMDNELKEKIEQHIATINAETDTKKQSPNLEELCLARKSLKNMLKKYKKEIPEEKIKEIKKAIAKAEKTEDEKKGNLFLEIIGMIVLLPLFFFGNCTDDDNMSEVELMGECRNKIQNSLRYPESFKTGLLDTTTKKVGDEIWIEVKFSAKNGFGGEIPTKGHCIYNNKKELIYFNVDL